MKDTPLWVNLLLMGRRRYAMQKMKRFLRGFETRRTMLEYVEDQTA